MDKETLEKVVSLLKEVVDYDKLINEYGMSYDDYYHCYDEERALPFKAELLLDELEELINKKQI